MNITAVSVQTPKKLLAEFKKGNRPEYNHKNDVLMDELDVLVSKYRQSLSVEDKKKLIEQERRILLDGLKNPEMTLARNYVEVFVSLPEVLLEERQCFESLWESRCQKHVLLSEKRMQQMTIHHVISRQ
jgi:hypothetical protein